MIRVLYHANCYDGFGAAWAAWKALGDTAEYHPIAYGDPPPPLLNHDQGKLYLLDFSFPRATLEALAKEFQLCVLDHHKTAAEDLAELPYATFDLKKSGAVLAWEHFHSTPPPWFVLYLQDRDLWTFELPDSREVSAALRSWPMDFAVWDRLAQELDRLAADGVAILRFQQSIVQTMCNQSWMEYLGGHLVPVANATAFFSEVGERLCEMYPNAPFAAYYLDRADGKRQWGLRSRGTFDVSGVAKSLGGGGHPGAAGFLTERR